MLAAAVLTRHMELPAGNLVDRNELWLNDGFGNFTATSGGPAGELRASTRAAAWADVDNDGDLDLFVG